MHVATSKRGENADTQRTEKIEKAIRVLVRNAEY